jgi:hypothetical protein
MRRNKTLSSSFQRMFKGFFYLIIKLAVITENAKGYFRFNKISVTKKKLITMSFKTKR